MQAKPGNAIEDIFSEIPTTYDLLNRVLTLGLDSHWRKRAARIGSAHGGDTWADMCSGTGRMTASLRQVAPAGTRMTFSGVGAPADGARATFKVPACAGTTMMSDNDGP